MKTTHTAPVATTPGLWLIWVWVVVAAASFHLSYLHSALGFLTVLYLFSLLQIARAPTWRKAFYPGLAVGLLEHDGVQPVQCQRARRRQRRGAGPGGLRVVEGPLRHALVVPPLAQHRVVPGARCLQGARS